MRKENLYKNFWKNGYVILKNYISKKEINKIFNQINDLTNISLNEKSSLLDVGCAKGFMLYDLIRLIPGITVKGIDISEYAIQNAKKQ